jgi:hypothetical protein
MADTMFGAFGRIAGSRTGLLLIAAWVAALLAMATF